MRPRRLGLELGMELDGQIPGMARQLGDLDEFAVGRAARNTQPVLDERALVDAVELVPVAVTLVHERDAVETLRERAWRKLAGVAAQSHRPAEIVDAEQVSQLVDELGWSVRIALGRIGVGEPRDIPGVFNGGP